MEGGDGEVEAGSAWSEMKHIISLKRWEASIAYKLCHSEGMMKIELHCTDEITFLRLRCFLRMAS